MEKKELVLDILQHRCRVVAFYPELARAVGSVKAGLLLSQFLYWSRNREWVHKTREEIYESTGLSRQEQETARALLKELGILEEKYRGMPRRLFFRIDTDRLLQVLEEKLQERQGDPNSKSRPEGMALSEGEFSANKKATFPPTRRRVFSQQENSQVSVTQSEGEFSADKKATFQPTRRRLFRRLEDAQVSVAQALGESYNKKNENKKNKKNKEDDDKYIYTSSSPNRFSNGSSLEGKEKKKENSRLTVEQVVEVFNRIASRCKEYKPVEALTPSLKARIQELVRTDSKFEDPSFWEKLFLRGRDIVIRINESRDVSNSRTLGWILRDGVLEMILGDVGTEEDRMLVPKENMQRFKEYVESKGYDWELLKEELKVYVPKARKTEEGFVFTTSSLIGRRIVYALATKDFPSALSMFALRSTSSKVEENPIVSQSSEGGV